MNLDSSFRTSEQLDFVKGICIINKRAVRQNVTAIFITTLIISSSVSLIFSHHNVVAQQQSPSNIVELLASDNRIAFTRYIGILDSPVIPSFPFSLINNGNEPARGIRIIPSSLTIEDQSMLSLAPSYIGSEEIKVNPPRIDELAEGLEQEVIFRLTRTIDNEATYTGQLQLVGENFEPIIISIDIAFKDNPWTYVFFSWIGVGIAIGLGAWYIRWKYKNEYEATIKDDSDIISHINGHIRSINIFRNTVPQNIWNDVFFKAYLEKKFAIIKYRNGLKLDPDAEAVKWFETVDELLHKDNLLARPPIPAVSNRPLKEILKPRVDSQHYLKIKKRMIDEHISASLKERSKWVYIIVTSIVSSFAAVIAAASYSGNPALNIAIAISIGFATYRLQDLLKAFSQEKAEP